MDRIRCIECKQFANIVYTGPGVVCEGDCQATGTLHPHTYSWNSCHLSRRRCGRYVPMRTTDGREIELDLVAYRQLS